MKLNEDRLSINIYRVSEVLVHGAWVNLVTQINLIITLLHKDYW
jgi:hypothetical protein